MWWQLFFCRDVNKTCVIVGFKFETNMVNVFMCWSRF